MSIIIYPEIGVANFKWYQEYNVIESSSRFGSQVIEVGEPVWRVSFQTISAKYTTASTIESFIDEVQGKRNLIALYHLATPVPSGTLRGVNVLDLTAQQGATSVTISTTSPVGSTLQKGDFIGLGTGYTQQVLRVQSLSTVDAFGKIIVSFSPALRNQYLAGSAVVWDKPRALFRQEVVSTGMQYLPGMTADGATFDLKEDWRP